MQKNNRVRTGTHFEMGNWACTEGAIAAGCNFADTLQIKGLYQTKPPLPFTPGLELSGEVIELGAEVTSPKLGDRVTGWVA